MMPKPDSVHTLKDKIAAMSPADRLRLAASLIEHGKLDIAHVLVSNIADELYALMVDHGEQW
jgi:hypothetical protein